MFSAYFIYDGFVYIDNDEKEFVKNHQKLYENIYKLDLLEIYTH